MFWPIKPPSSQPLERPLDVTGFRLETLAGLDLNRRPL